MTFRVRVARGAEDELVRLHEFMLEHDATERALAERALEAMGHAISGLERSPFSHRKATGASSPFLRELVIPFGSAGYVAPFEIEGRDVVTVLAVRHQREDDYL